MLAALIHDILASLIHVNKHAMGVAIHCCWLSDRVTLFSRFWPPSSQQPHRPSSAPANRSSSSRLLPWLHSLLPCRSRLLWLPWHSRSRYVSACAWVICGVCGENARHWLCMQVQIFGVYGKTMEVGLHLGSFQVYGKTLVLCFQVQISGSMGKLRK